jgi:(1->4)-alpha-D-glucan 1-alpha-D-glucosylmutase
MPPAMPIATYRLQLSADFDFDAAAAVVPYLKALGITHLYASPFMRPQGIDAWL